MYLYCMRVIAALAVSSLAMTGCGGMSAGESAAAPPKDVKELARQSLSTIDGELKVAGLEQPVEVIRDEWGVPHIYAQNTHDLFFAQGFVMAQDRLWQMEWWRRQFGGQLAEILGPAAFERDRLARLIKFRGPLRRHRVDQLSPRGQAILTAYANGVNAYIDQNGSNLPVEFKLTGIRPESVDGRNGGAA